MDHAPIKVMLVEDNADDAMLAGMGMGAAQDVLNAPQFGAQAQTQRPLATLQEGAVKLS